MSAKKIYRSAKQEAIRKGLIAKLWTLARQYGMEKEDLYDAIEAEAKRKPRRGIVIYGANWTLRRSTKRRSYGGQADEAKRVSISSLKIWQLKQVIEALFPGQNGKHGNDGNGKEKREEVKTGAQVIEYEDWRGDK